MQVNPIWTKLPLIFLGLNQMSIIAVVVVALSYAVFNNQDRLKFEESVRQ
jgi:hypothetical protein